jgi:hypothetical protein
MAQPAIHNGVARLTRVTRQSMATHKEIQRLPEGYQAREDRQRETKDAKGFKKPGKSHPSRAAIQPVVGAKSIIPSRPAQDGQGQPPVERTYHYASINVRTLRIRKDGHRKFEEDGNYALAEQWPLHCRGSLL